MRYQIKEALDKVSYMTRHEANELAIGKAIPDDVRITLTNCHNHQLEFRYSSGQLFLWAKRGHIWMNLE